MKHLNVTREEAARVIIDFELNAFCSYLVLANGSPIIFAKTYGYTETIHNPELVKYQSEWNLPTTISPLANRKLSAMA